jgi:hypothetical protein
VLNCQVMTDSTSTTGADPGLMELVPAYRGHWEISGSAASGYAAYPRPRGPRDTPVTAATAQEMRAKLGPADDERAREKAPPRVTVRLYLRGDDAERMLAAELAGEGRWELLDVQAGEAYRPYAVERSAADPSGPASPGAALRRVREDADRWEQVTGRPAGP